MPFITVDYFAGISDADARLLQERLTNVVVKAFNSPAGAVRIYLRPLTPAQVYVGSGEHATGLPVIRAEFLPGRTLDQKRDLVRGLAHATAETLRLPVEQVRTVLFERAKEEWARGDTMVCDAQ